MVHKPENRLHITAGIALAAIGAFLGWSQYGGIDQASVGAVLGGLAGALGGKVALRAID